VAQLVEQAVGERGGAAHPAFSLSRSAAGALAAARAS
jgi:hypothetical protein